MEGEVSARTLIDQGGWVMWPLLALSVVALALMAEGGLVLARARAHRGPLIEGIRVALRQRSSAGAIEACNRSRSALGRVLRAGLLRYRRRPDDIERTMELAAQFELARLQRGLAVLATVANLAPLLGFLGTVTGLIEAFGALKLHALTNPSLVAGGIQEALVSTAVGLSVAIPVQLVLNLLHGRIAGIAAQIEAAAEELLLALEEITGGSQARA